MATFHHGKIYLLDHGIITDLKGEKFCYSGTERNRTCLHHAKKNKSASKNNFSYARLSNHYEDVRSIKVGFIHSQV